MKKRENMLQCAETSSLVILTNLRAIVRFEIELTSATDAWRYESSRLNTSQE